MNLTQLRLFRDVAREQSFVKAAQKNFISQPAVSVHIRKLEEELGKKLLNRSPHNIELTPDGLAALADVKEILRLCDGLKIRSSYSQGVLEGNIRIASIHSIGQLENEPFIAFEQGIPTREATDRFFQERGINLDLRMTNDNIFTLKKAVEAGIGVSIVPSDTVEEEVQRGTLSRITIRDADTQRPLALLKLKKSRLSTPVEVFIERLLARR